MTEDLMVFTPGETTVKELTPEERKAKALALIDKPLDEIIKIKREENRKQRQLEKGDGGSGSSDRKRSKKKKQQKNMKKYVDLKLTDRQMRNYMSFANVDTSGYDVRLRLKMVKKNRY